MGRHGAAAGGTCLSDIFREVDEEIRRDQLRKLWDRYGIVVLAAAVLLVLGVGGWRGYEWWQAKQAAEAGTAFEAAAQLAQEGKHKEAEEAFARIATTGMPSYRMLARMREAAGIAQRDPKAAIAVYQELAANSNLTRIQQDFAAVRAGQLMVDAGTFDETKALLEPLTAADRPFRHSARALMALAAWRANDAAAVKHWSDMVLADSETPVSTRGQVEMLLTLSAEAGKS